jgi:hypothetical protein
MNGGEREPISLTSVKLSKTHSGPASVVSPGSSGWPKTAMAPASLQKVAGGVMVYLGGPRRRGRAFLAMMLFFIATHF